MLKAIRQLFGGAGNETEQNVANLQASPEIAGYFMPCTAAELLAPPSRKQCLQQLWESCALPKDLYDSFWLQPLHALVSMMQTLPAAPQGEYAREGGLIDVTLRTTTFAVRLAKGHMLPPGAAPEEQAAQNVLWNTVVFYAALFHFLPLLSRFEGEYQSGRAWLPGITVPDEPFRFRFHASQLRAELSAGQSALTAARLLPSGALAWLSALPAAVNALTMTVARQPGTLPVIDELVREAVKLAGGGNLSVGPLIASTETGFAAAPVTPEALNNVAVLPGLTSAAGLQSAVGGTPALKSDLPECQGQSVSPAQNKVNAESGPAVLLSSALDSGGQDGPLAEMTVAPADDDTQSLLALMGAGVSAPVSQQLPGETGVLQKVHSVSAEDQAVLVRACIQPEVIAESARQESPPEIASGGEAENGEMASSVSVHLMPPPAGTVSVHDTSAGENAGEAFWGWLSAGFKRGDIRVNMPESRAHIISGFVFLCVPEIFHLYIKEKEMERTARNGVQKAFEKLGRHRTRQGQRFFTALLYQEPGGIGSYRRINGYLVKASSLYGGSGAPGDSRLLIIP